MSPSTYNQTIKNQFLEILELAIKDQTFVSLVLMNKKNRESDIKKLAIRPVLLKKGLMLSFVSRFFKLAPGSAIASRSPEWCPAIAVAIQ